MELLDRLIRFATLRPRTEFEIKRWFKRKKVSEKDTEVAIRELKNSGLVDDEAFAKWWVDQRVTFRPKARRLLVMELMQKGVDRELARDVVEVVAPTDEELAFSAFAKGFGGSAIAFSDGGQLIERKKRAWEKLGPEERKKKIVTFLQMRGFGWEVIKKVISG